MGVPPDLTERYRLGPELGRGAFGSVYRASPVAGGPEVAVKLLGMDHDPGRFAREVEALRRLEHPHVLRCLDAGEGWLALELADGNALPLWRDPAHLKEAWTALLSAARGVAALHAAGIAHRDLKPENLLRVGERWVVADLGLAKVTDLETITKTGMIQGTPRYMAPEQALGKKPGPPADVWALGLMAYELLEGRGPWPEGEPPIETLMRVAQGERPKWLRGPDRLSPAGFAAVEATLAEAPGDRPVDLEEWADTLAGERLLDADQSAAHGAFTVSLLSAAEPRRGVTTRRRPAQRRSWLPVAGVFGAVALGAAALVGGEGGREAPAPPTPTLDPVVVLARETERVVDRWLEAPVVDHAGRPVGPEEPTATTTRSLRLLSPVYFHELGTRMEPLGDLERRFAAGLDAVALAPEARTALQDLDARFRRLGLPRPMHPMAYVLPAPLVEVDPAEDPERVRGLSRFWLGREAPARRQGWLGAGLAALRRLEQISANRREVEDAFRKRERDDPWPRAVRTHLEAQRLRVIVGALRELESPLQSLNSSLRSSLDAGEVWSHYRDALETAEEAAYALLRAAREEPEVAPLAVTLLYTGVFEPQDLVLHPARLAGEVFPPVPAASTGPVARLGCLVQRRWTLLAQRELNGVEFPEAVPTPEDLGELEEVLGAMLSEEHHPALVVLALGLWRELLIWRSESRVDPEDWLARGLELERRARDAVPPELWGHHWDSLVQAFRRHAKYHGGLAPELRGYVGWVLESSPADGDPKSRRRLREMLER